MDAVFKALADPSRRRMLDSLNARGGHNLVELCEGLDMARQSVSKHAEVFAKLAAEQRSVVTFDIEHLGEQCKLTVVHEFFDPDSTAVTMVIDELTAKVNAAGDPLLHHEWSVSTPSAKMAGRRFA